MASIESFGIPLQESVRLMVQLHNAMLKDADSAETDGLRERSATLWYQLTDVEREYTDKLSEYLYQYETLVTVEGLTLPPPPHS